MEQLGWGPAILVAEALFAYLIVLWVHSVRPKVGLGPFYALLGGLTVVMSWVTDAGVKLEIGGLTFMVGSTVFYTAILLGVFVVYVFDGPAPTRISILTVAGLSALMPVVATLIHVQMAELGLGLAQGIPVPSMRINTASLATTAVDLVFLAIAWEFVGRRTLNLKMWWRVALTLLGVMVLDVVLFSTGAFAGTPDYLSIMGGTLLSRLVVASIATPLLYAYVSWQARLVAEPIENRPVLAIFQEIAEARADLDSAKKTIARHRAAEKDLEFSRQQLEELVEERTQELTVRNLELYEANEAKRIFLANMSHELRTPLNSIIGFSGVLATGKAGELSQEQERQIIMVNNSGRYLLTLVDDILDLARVESSKSKVEIEPFVPKELAQEVIEMMQPVADEKGLEIRFVCDSREPDPFGSDPGKVKHVLLNLMGNAIKFTSRGFVEIRVTRPEEGLLEFAVEDSGPGISRDDVSRVFDPFTQLELAGEVKPKGTGLGLALCRAYARMLGGDVSVRSELGLGSTFTLTLSENPAG